MENALVSIIIRTCGRPQVLANALKSVHDQSYSNIETIIVEDGENVSQKYIAANFSDMNISYRCTGNKMGRCHAGNLGMESATGKYINFLDDDDYLFPYHVETLVAKLEETGYMAAYAIAEEHQVKKNAQKSKEGFVKRKLVRYKQPYNKLLLCYLNYIPIQSIMFQRSLYEKMGGFDVTLEVLEDWDLWVRYSMYCDFLYVPMVTSVYHTPYKGRGKRQRESYMQKASLKVLKKHDQYSMTFNVSQINREMDYVLNVFNKKSALFYMQKIRNFLLYRDI